MKKKKAGRPKGSKNKKSEKKTKNVIKVEEKDELTKLINLLHSNSLYLYDNLFDKLDALITTISSLKKEELKTTEEEVCHQSSV